MEFAEYSRIILRNNNFHEAKSSHELPHSFHSWRRLWIKISADVAFNSGSWVISDKIDGFLEEMTREKKKVREKEIMDYLAPDNTRMLKDGATLRNIALIVHAGIVHSRLYIALYNWVHYYFREHLSYCSSSICLHIDMNFYELFNIDLCAQLHNCAYGCTDAKNFNCIDDLRFRMRDEYPVMFHR